ncbi:MAG: choice-of-anchor B family protein [Gemmatimonadota bacterium]|nr:choice-of-anchor B family protein [Gammaproteobacteria bacterium]MDE2781402.1 choice-of-anchor B family protein [Gemmatimonadota bacterium]
MNRKPTIAFLAALSSLVALAWAAPPLAAQSGSFGNSMIIDGDELLIAEPTTSFRPGSVYIYANAGGGWRESTVLRAPESERADGFGTMLARTGNTLFIGQRGGPIHVFERTDGGPWAATGTIEGDDIAGASPSCRYDGYCGNDFGVTIAAHEDWLFVGAPGAAPAPRRRGGEQEAEPQGAVYTYQRSAGGQWTRRGQLQPADGAEGDRFGAAILFTPHGALIGAPQWNAGGDDGERAGRVYHYRMVDGGWDEGGVLESAAESNANFGSALAAAGDRVLIGAPGTDDSRGAVYTHSWSADLARWVPAEGRLAFSGGESGDRFGEAVAFAGDDVWVGAPTTRGYELGSAFVFEAAADGSLPAEARRIQLPQEETVEGDRFGGLIVAGAGVVAVGAPGMHHQAGSVHVFERGDGGWGEGEMLVSAPDMLAALVGEERRCIEGKVGPFDCDEVELLAYVPPSLLRAEERARGVRANDNWGWTDPMSGREYALVGRNDGTSFVDITDPTNPMLVGDLPKPWGTPPSQLWRDIKTYRDHAFVVADGAGEHGMQVFDLTRLRDISVDEMPALFEPDFHYTRIGSSHNIAINEETGIAYTIGGGGAGDTCGGGLHMIDIDDPKNPEFVGCAPTGGTHDTQCVIYRGPDEDYQGRELCFNSNGRTFQIQDVTDKDNPVEVAAPSSPNPAYIHQGWLTEDHRYFYQDDEADVIAGNAETTRTLIWDVSDLEDPVLVREFMGSMPASAHNLYIRDDLMYQANYLYGLHVLDISDPENPREVGYFDTAPYKEGPGFGGAWSNYPFFPSGTVIVTSMQEGLFILKKRVRPVS